MLNKVKIRTDSFDPECVTNDEIKEMEDALYFDIPKELRSKYSENEKGWAKKDLNVNSFTSSSFSNGPVIPIGINSEMAFVVKTTLGYIASMISSEKLQFFKAWKSSLMRSKSREQYDARLKKFTIGDPNLKGVLEQIYRDEDILKYRDSLPVEREEEEFEKREDSAVETISLENEENQEEEVGEGEFESYFLYYNCYNTKKVWKASKIMCNSTVPPAFAICDKYILMSFYKTEHIVYSKLYDMNFKLQSEWKCFKNGPLRCTVNNNGTMAVSDGVYIHQKIGNIIYRHTINNQIITSISLGSDDYLFIGTYNGQIYDINPFKIRSYSKSLDCVPILTVSPGIGQTITSILTAESKVFNAIRPVTSIVKGTFVIFLTKYGVVIIRSKIHDYIHIEFKPPKDKKVDIDTILPWYDNGIFFNGEKLAVLYPDGSVIVKKKV